MSIMPDKLPAPSYFLQEVKSTCMEPNRVNILYTRYRCQEASLPYNHSCKCECQYENN